MKLRSQFLTLLSQFGRQWWVKLTALLNSGSKLKN